MLHVSESYTPYVENERHVETLYVIFKHASKHENHSLNVSQQISSHVKSYLILSHFLQTPQGPNIDEAVPKLALLLTF